MKDRRFNVLFLCTANSDRSIIVESIINRVGAGKFKGYSAGIMPKGEVNPLTINLLNKLNYDTTALRSESWEEFAAPTRRLWISSSPFATPPPTRSARFHRGSR